MFCVLLFVCLSFYLLASLFSIYEFDCPSGIFRPSFNSWTITFCQQIIFFLNSKQIWVALKLHRVVNWCQTGKMWSVIKSIRNPLIYYYFQSTVYWFNVMWILQGTFICYFNILTKTKVNIFVKHRSEQ